MRMFLQARNGSIRWVSLVHKSFGGNSVGRLFLSGYFFHKVLLYYQTGAQTIRCRDCAS